VRFRSYLLSLLALCAFAVPPATALAAPGDPLVVADDTLAPPETFLAAVYRVSLADGLPTQLTAPEALFDAKGLAVTGPDTVVTVGVQSVATLDLETDQLADRAALDAGELRDVALAPDGSLVAIDLGEFSQAADGRVLRIDPTDGSSTPLSSGGLLHNPFGIAIDEDGTIFVTNQDDTGAGQVVRVDPDSGAQSIVASNPLVGPWGIAFLPDGDLVVADAAYNGAFRGALVRIDPDDGEQTPLFLENLNGPIDNATGVTVDAAGEVLVSERNSAQIDRVNLETGVAQLVGEGIPSPLDLEPEPGIAPTTVLLSGPSGTTNVTTPTFTFAPSQYGAKSSCQIDGGPAVPCRRTFTSPALAAGAHTFRVSSSYLGAEGPPVVRNFAVDPGALDTRITSGPSGPTTETEPTFTFEAPGGGTSFTCSLDEEIPSACTSPFPVPAPLADGPHSFTVRADGDAIGDTRLFTVDTVPPETSITSGPGEGASTNAVQPTFTFGSTEGSSTFTCTLDGAPAPCTSVFTPAAPLAEGAHTLTVTATDPAGNTDPTPVTRNFTVDLTPPETTITGGPEGTTDEAAPTFTFTASEAGAAFRCSIDGATATACASPFTVAPALPDGPHTFSVHAIDSAGNVGTAKQRDFTVDTVVPATSITAGPAGPTNVTAPTFVFQSTKPGSTFVCAVDGGGAAPCVSPFQTAGLDEGAHTFTVIATDAVGNTDPTGAVRQFTVDTTPPETDLDPFGSPTNNRSPVFEFTSEPGATFTCRIDNNGPAEACASPFAAPPLADGPHTVTVTATDEAGNIDPDPPQDQFTVDTVAPRTTIEDGPDDDTTDRRPTFSFEADEDATFACSVDDGLPIACDNTFQPVAPLDLGAHTFEVRATDRAGNTEPVPARRSFRVVATAKRGPPDPPIQTPAPPSPPQAISPQLGLRASLKGHLLRVRVTANPAATGNVTLKLTARAKKRRLTRQVTFPLTAGLAKAKLRLRPGLNRVRLRVAYAGDVNYLAGTMARTVRQQHVRKLR
jgi:sugar lactone lactonase YvrE